MLAAIDNQVEIFNQGMVFIIILMMGSMTELTPYPWLRIYAGWSVILLYILTAVVNWLVVIYNVIKTLCIKIRMRKM